MKNYKKKLLIDLTEKNNEVFKKLCNKNVITEKELKYFTYSFKNASCHGKMYILPKIHERLYNVSGRPVISNCGTTTEKMSEFLDHHLQPVMKGGKSYVKDTNHFLEKCKQLGKVPRNAILVTVDVLGLYPSIPHGLGLKALHEKLEERNYKSVPTAGLVNMADFVLKNNYFEFDSCIKQQISGTAIGTKFAPPYACIFMDKVESAFLESENTKPWVRMRYIDDIFFIWTESEDKLDGFLQRLNAFHPNLKFTYDKSKASINFLDVTVSINGEDFKTDLYCKPNDCHQFLEFNSMHLIHNKISIAYIQGLRIKRLCSKEDTFEKHLENLRSWFGKGGYPKELVDNQIRRILESKPEQLFVVRWYH